MGHYEQDYEYYDKQRRAELKAEREKLVKKYIKAIDKKIEKDGLSRLLAELMVDNDIKLD